MAALPLTVTYTTEAELQELERLRMRVALLQQEINLEQVQAVFFNQLTELSMKYIIQLLVVICGVVLVKY